MKKFLTMLILTVQAYGSQFGATPEFLLRTFEAVEVFEGDRHNQFAGNFIAVLNDASRWKVHPMDEEKFRQWTIDDVVHIRLRTSHYWFKREHKFELYNHIKKESVRAMLINYPTQPLFVQTFQDVEVSRELRKRIMRDQYGGGIKDSKGAFIEESYWHINYQRDLYLSDGTVWRLKSAWDWNKFQEGKFVYIGANYESDGLYFFMIAGDQREAVHSAVVRVR